MTFFFVANSGAGFDCLLSLLNNGEKKYLFISKKKYLLDHIAK